MRSGKSILRCFVHLGGAACAVYFGPFGPTGQAGSDDHSNGAKPELLLFVAVAVLSFLPSVDETPALLIGRYHLGALLLLPFLSGEGEKSWRRRPDAVLRSCLLPLHLRPSPISQDIRHGARDERWSSDPSRCDPTAQDSTRGRALSFSRRSNVITATP